MCDERRAAVFGGLSISSNGPRHSAHPPLPPPPAVSCLHPPAIRRAVLHALGPLKIIFCGSSSVSTATPNPFAVTSTADSEHFYPPPEIPFGGRQARKTERASAERGAQAREDKRFCRHRCATWRVHSGAFRPTSFD
ncbi:hypothetical protein SKAU_G00340900 [Synaphobranchus kaupii]|uniref:Uncharacterized protein n=1 Tax=Synaphobranchus kaupii TaxID=118154 RepID=A0A9Q1EN29_SYNKA|nr:hypothetical protein SKAU_G00340900 [Synaphobranchus kaupii]